MPRGLGLNTISHPFTYIAPGCQHSLLSSVSTVNCFNMLDVKFVFTCMWDKIKADISSILYIR